MAVLWYAVLMPLGHGVRHGQMVNHHDVLVGLIHGGGGLHTGTDGRTAVWDGSSGRLDLRPLEKNVVFYPASSSQGPVNGALFQNLPPLPGVCAMYWHCSAGRRPGLRL